MRPLLTPFAVVAFLFCLTLLPVGFAQPVTSRTASYLPAVFKAPNTPGPSPTPRIATSTPPPGATPVPPASLFIASSRGRYLSTSNYVIEGELLNTGGLPAYDAKVTASLYTASNTLVATGTGSALLTRIDPGARIPFRVVQINPPQGIAEYGLFVEWQPTTALDYRAVAVTSRQVRDSSGLEVYGTLRNDSDAQLDSVRVAVTLYDAANKVVGVFVEGQGVGLASGATGTYSVKTLASGLVYSSYTVQAEGYVPPSNSCDAAYPTVCIPPPPPDLNCPDISYRNFTVLPPDPHRFDTDSDGIGCEAN